MVRAKFSGNGLGLDGGGVAQVLEYFCARKPCAAGAATAPLELAVEGLGVVSVAFGEEVHTRSKSRTCKSEGGRFALGGARAYFSQFRSFTTSKFF